MKFVNSRHGKEDSHVVPARFTRLSAILMILPVSMAAGWLLGYYVVDRCLSSFPWGSIVCTLIGAGGGFFEIVKILIPSRGQGDHSADGNG
jgi:F0F1-type ATP synthase assembly protein I